MHPAELLAERFPQLTVRDVVVIEHGWDSLVYEVNGEWVFRFPRRPEVERRLEAELALLPELAPALPVPVPRYELVARNGLLCVGHRKLDGEPASAAGEPAGADIAAFLTALHAFPPERARALGADAFDPIAWRAHFGGVAAGFRRRVFPLLEPGECTRAAGLFADIEQLEFEPRLVHGDLVPEHILVRDGRVAGVIDWSDARVGDPALDLAWPLHGAASAVAKRVAAVYPLDDDLRRRALFYHRFAPWYSVTYGLETGRVDRVDRGLAAVRERLPG